MSPTALSPAPLSALRISRYTIPAYGPFPNTSLHLDRPLLIYHSCFPPGTSPSSIERHIKSIHIAQPAWRYSMYPTHHFHSTTHELLCVFSGEARLCFGGAPKSDFDGAVEVKVRHGDVILIPAGVGHALLEVFEGKFEMVGSYPEKAERWDMCTAASACGKDSTEWKRIKELGWWEADPLYGGQRGPLFS